MSRPTEHWWAQRVTAIALVPLTLWFVAGVVGHVGAGHEAVAAWLGQPLVAVLTILLIAATFHHAQLGLQVVYEDYIHSARLRIAADLATKFAAFVLAGIAILSVIRLAL